MCMTRKLTLMFFALLLLFSCRNESLTNTTETSKEKIAIFVDFENNLKKNVFAKGAENPTSYSIPFGKLINNFLEKRPNYKNAFEKEVGIVDTKVASQTFGDKEKLVLFPIKKDNIVFAVLVCRVNENRDFADFHIIKKSIEAQNYIHQFQKYYNWKTTAREGEIEEVVITVLVGFSPTIPSEEEQFGSGYSGTDFNGGNYIHGGGGGGTISDTTTQTNSDPCAKARELANKMTEILNSTDIKTAVQIISNLIQQQEANGQIKENAFAIGVDSNGRYHVSPISTATDSKPHSVAYNHFDPSSGITQVGVFHNHTSDNSNSPGDFYELISSNVSYPSYITNFAQNSLGEVFALNIYDRQKAMAFLQKYPKDQNIDGPGFKGVLLDEYERFRSTADWTVNNNTNAGQVALIAFLERFDTGVSLSKKIDASNFKTFKASNFNQTVYGGQQQTTYTTTDCN